MITVKDILPRGLRLCREIPTIVSGLNVYLFRNGSAIRHSRLSTLRSAVGCLIANDFGIKGAEVFATADLFSLYLESIIRSYKSDTVRTPQTSISIAGFVGKWWGDVLNMTVSVPQSILWDQTLRISSANKNILGTLVLYRGRMLRFSFVESSTLEPLYKKIQRDRPNLKSSLG